MMDPQTAQEIADEAERILRSEVFLDALASLRDRALRELLAATGPDADITRREKADYINALLDLPSAIQHEMLSAQHSLKPRGGVA